ATATARRELDRLRREVADLRPRRAAGPTTGQYALDPLGYARDVLGVEWWAKQREVARAVVEHRAVFVKASHGIGKTHLAGGLICWHFDSFNPGLTLTTAPTAAQLNGVTWREVRMQRRGRDMLPKAACIEGRYPDGRLDPGHLACGYTANDANA